MLSYLCIKNFAIIDQLELELTEGFTVLTGETGAGKSIVIDALAIALGARAEAHQLRDPALNCELTVIFDLSHNSAAQHWLLEHELAQEKECIIRRVITPEGRSRIYINGVTCTLQQAKELSSWLINIHGQHEQQGLLKKEKHRELLDHFANHPLLLEQTKKLFQQWQEANHQLSQLRQAANDQATWELLNYQVAELQEIAPQPGEWQALDQQHKKLCNLEQLRDASMTAVELLTEGEQSTSSLLQTAHHNLHSVRHLDKHLDNACNLLEQAQVLTTEATNSIQHYLDQEGLEPEQLQQIEMRLSQLHQLARKHHVPPDALPGLQRQLEEAVTKMQNAEETATQLEIRLKALVDEYHVAASQLSVSRKNAATQLAAAIEQQLPQLGMPGGRFQVHFEPLVEPTLYGTERMEFWVSANPGQPLQPLAKVASGGELSRLSLAIQVITAEQENTPTLIFDEVDVGIGGNTAAVVGQLLRRLGTTAQVLCITHQPQVAAQGQQHLQVQKSMTKDRTQTHIISLTSDQRVAEIARMLGGIKITPQTLAHARELIIAG